MDREEAEHPVVVLAQVGLALLRRPVVGDRGDREEGREAPIEHARRDEHRPTECPQERRRPADVERLVDDADDVVLRAERLDPRVLLPTEVEQGGGVLVLVRDRVEHPTDERAVLGGSRFSGSPGRPQIAGEPDHLAANGLVFALGRGEDMFRRQRRRAHRVAHLPGEQVAPEAAIAIACREDDLLEMARQVIERRPSRGRGALEPRPKGDDGRVVRVAKLRPVPRRSGRRRPAVARSPSPSGAARPAAQARRRRASPSPLR